MQKIALATLSAFLLPLLLVAQNAAAPTILCGDEIFHQIIREQHPALQQSFDATFQAARQTQAQARGPLNVNVVVHVIWKDAAENLADSIILDQIAILNADYNRQNADTANLRPVFQPVAGSTDIHFQLAAINRVQTSQLFTVDLLGTNLLTEVKHSAQGGSDAWDTEHYLNIWVCKIQPLAFGSVVIGQILGFAFPPNNLANWPADSGSPNADEDGVVIDFRAFGSNNPNLLQIPGTTGNLVVKGRTPVHEVGHYFGLRHIWGDGGFLGPNDCAQSDGIDDTPFANAQSNFDCDVTKNTCPQVEAFYNADMPDLIENYMDYASEDCMNMFTQGQAALMRNVLQGPRVGLLTAVATGSPAAADAHLRLYPNPASGAVTAEFRLTSPAASTFQLISPDGRLVKTIALSASQTRVELNLSGLPAGLYFAELQSAGNIFTQKLMIE